MTTHVLSDAPLRVAAPLPGPRRRIVILTEDSKPSLGGIAEYLHQLAIAAAASHEVVIVTSVSGAASLNSGLPIRYQEERWFRAQERRRGDEIPILRRCNTLLWHVTRPYRVRRLLAAIHAQNANSSYVIGRLSPVTFPWCRACEDLGLPYSAIGYGLELVEPLRRRAARQRLEFGLAANHWFVISADTREKLKDLGVPSIRQSLLSPGVALPTVVVPSVAERRDVRRRLGIGTTQFVFSLAYLRRRKGLDLGIEAFATIAPRFPNLKYVIGGSGPEGAALIALARERGIGDRVLFVGSIDEVTKAVLFADCEFFILPNRADAHDVEGFGIVFLEAGLFGKAVIGGNNGGVPDAVVNGTTGLLVDTCDAQPLAEAMGRLLDEPGLAARLGGAGRRRAERDFSWQERGARFANLLDDLNERDTAAPRRPSSTMVRIRRRFGSAVNRTVSGASVMSAVASRGRLARYIMMHTEPADQEVWASAMLEWLERAFAAGTDGGTAASYHIAHGWARPYPEVTGYLIPTLLHYAVRRRDERLRRRAQAAGSWLARTRLSNGAICRKQWFEGNTTPSIFNTAQVVDGWCALARARVSGDGSEDWLALARRSGDWLADEQEEDGRWVRHAFNGVPHTYYARVAAPLATLAVATGASRYADAARRALDWVVAQQRSSGWFEHAGFTVKEAPTTHTIGYVLEGLLHGGQLLEEPRYLESATRAADRLLAVYEQRALLPGRFGPEWRPRARWRCLTGDAQVGLVWCVLHTITGDERYRRAAADIADGIRRTVRVTSEWPEISGAVQGSDPPWGDYDPFAYPAHAVKFSLDLIALLEA